MEQRIYFISKLNFETAFVQDKNGHFYLNCFSSEEYKKLYGIFDTIKLNDLIKKMVYTDYPSVKRFIIYDELSNPIAFFHIDTKFRREYPIQMYEMIGVNYVAMEPDKKICFLSGGIAINKINSGKGVLASTITIDFIFNTLNIDEVFVQIHSANQRSLKIFKRLGFMYESEKIINANTNLIEYTLALTKFRFPNTFSANILKRIKYETR